MTMSNGKKRPDERKTTSEKPISLAPLTLEEALEGLVKVDPDKLKEKAQEEKKPDSE